MKISKINSLIESRKGEGGGGNKTGRRVLRTEANECPAISQL